MVQDSILYSILASGILRELSDMAYMSSQGKVEWD